MISLVHSAARYGEWGWFYVLPDVEKMRKAK